MQKPIDSNLLETVKTLVENGHEDEAQHAISQAITENKSQPLGVYIRYCQLLEKSKDFEQAQKIYSLITNLFPNSPSGYAGLTRIALTQNNYQQAYQQVSCGLKQLPNQFELLILQAKTLTELSDFSEARSNYENIIKSLIYLGIINRVLNKFCNLDTVSK